MGALVPAGSFGSTTNRKGQFVSDISTDQNELGLQAPPAEETAPVKTAGRKKAIVIKANGDDGPDAGAAAADAPAAGETAADAPAAGTPDDSAEPTSESEAPEAAETPKVKVRKKVKVEKKKPAGNGDDDSRENVNVAPDEVPVPESSKDASADDAPPAETPSKNSGGRRRGKKGRQPQQIKGPKHDPDAPKILLNDLSRMTMCC